MRIEGRADPAVRASDLACGLQQIAFAVNAAIGDHGAVQTEDDSVERQRRL